MSVSTSFDDVVYSTRYLALSVAVGAASSSAAGLFTNPVDVVKTEMQVTAWWV